MGNNISESLKKTHVHTNGHSMIEYTFQWKIEKFDSLSPGVGKCITSPWIKLDTGNEWEVRVYPEGFNDRLKDYVSLWVKRKSSDVEQMVNFKCSIGNGRGKNLLERVDEKNLTLDSTLGWADFCHRSQIIESHNNVLRSGNLNLNFTLEFIDEKELTNPFVENADSNKRRRTIDVCSSMKNMLANATFSDLKIVVEYEIFKVHKAVLCERSEVFKTMLNSELESHKNFINITDISKDSMRELLRFMYAGEVGELQIEMAKELFYAADKYDISLLKDFCSKALAGYLSEDTALEILLLADKHLDPILRSASVRFISHNIHSIQKKSEWLQLLKDHPKLANLVVEQLGK